MKQDFVDVLGILIKNLNEEKYRYASMQVANVYLTSFKYPDNTLMRAHIGAKAIEKLDQEERFKEAVRIWSGGKAINPKLFTDVGSDGTIDVNLLFLAK